MDQFQGFRHVLTTENDTVKITVSLPLDSVSSSFDVEVVESNETSKQTFVLSVVDTGQTLIVVPIELRIDASQAVTKFKRSKSSLSGPCLIFSAPCTHQATCQPMQEVPCSQSQETGEASVEAAKGSLKGASPCHPSIPAPSAAQQQDNASDDDADDASAYASMYGPEMFELKRHMQQQQISKSQEEPGMHQPEASDREQQQQLPLWATASESLPAPSAAQSLEPTNMDAHCDSNTLKGMGDDLHRTDTRPNRTAKSQNAAAISCPTTSAPLQPATHTSSPGGNTSITNTATIQAANQANTTIDTTISKPSTTPTATVPTLATTTTAATTINNTTTNNNSNSNNNSDSNSSSTSCQGPAVPEAESLDCTNLALMLSSHAFKAGRVGAPSSHKKAAKEERRKVSAMLENIVAMLETKGYCVCDNYVPMDLVINARKELKVMEPHYTAGEIWVGKDADVGATFARRDVRGDVVLWLDQQALTATKFVKEGAEHKCCFHNLHGVLRSMDRLITGELPPRTHLLRHVRERSDAMLAMYPGGGARFARHIDNTANDGRRLTVLCYLNPNWRKSSGGQLRLTLDGGQLVDVYPEAGRLAMFLSKTVAHEVMPTEVPRHSLTLWYYDILERAEAVANAKVTGAAGASAAAQQEARNLIRDILSGAGEEVEVASTTGIQASDNGVVALKLRVARMTVPALGIVASITGAPSTQAFVEAVQAMTPPDIMRLRDSLANMGLEHTPTV